MGGGGGGVLGLTFGHLAQPLRRRSEQRRHTLYKLAPPLAAAQGVATVSELSEERSRRVVRFRVHLLSMTNAFLVRKRGAKGGGGVSAWASNVAGGSKGTAVPSRGSVEPLNLRKPAACSNVFGPMPLTCLSSSRHVKPPPRAPMMAAAREALSPAT